MTNDRIISIIHVMMGERNNYMRMFIHEFFLQISNNVMISPYVKIKSKFLIDVKIQWQSTVMTTMMPRHYDDEYELLLVI